MKTVGLIVEYNPLHNGHVYHFEKAKQASGAEASVAVMSGHFLQRGEPAVANKWARAEMALRMGADVVIELPAAYACQPAEWFAYGAVSLLEATGVVDSLVFGSEDGRIAPFEALADALYREPEAFQAALKLRLKQGASYPSAYAAAAAELLARRDPLAAAAPCPALELDQPNNSLGLHYMLALRRIASSIRPLTIARHKAGFHEAQASDERIASATAIRRIIEGPDGLAGIAPYVPSYTLDILRREQEAGRAPLNWEHFAGQLLTGIVTRSAAELSALHEMNEGIEHRIKRLLPELDLSSPRPVNRLLEALKTKRYTRTKLQRTLLSIVLNRQKHDFSPQKLAAGVTYLRVLGFSAKGQALLKDMQRKAAVPIVTKVARATSDYLALDLRATAVYTLGCRHSGARELHRDYYEPPLRIGT